VTEHVGQKQLENGRDHPASYGLKGKGRYNLIQLQRPKLAKRSEIMIWAVLTPMPAISTFASPTSMHAMPAKVRLSFSCNKVDFKQDAEFS